MPSTKVSIPTRELLKRLDRGGSASIFPDIPRAASNPILFPQTARGGVPVRGPDFWLTPPPPTAPAANPFAGVPAGPAPSMQNLRTVGDAAAEAASGAGKVAGAAASSTATKTAGKLGLRLGTRLGGVVIPGLNALFALWGMYDIGRSIYGATQDPLDTAEFRASQALAFGDAMRQSLNASAVTNRNSLLRNLVAIQDTVEGENARADERLSPYFTPDTAQRLLLRDMRGADFSRKGEVQGYDLLRKILSEEGDSLGSFARPSYPGFGEVIARMGIGV